MKIMPITFYRYAKKILHKGFTNASPCANINSCQPTASAECRGVEQLVARRAHNPKVEGSSPSPATNSPSRERQDG